MTADQLNALYAQLEQEYFGEIDNLGLSYLDDGLDWVDIHHLFESPMYYVEYALTGVVALDFWQDSKENWDDAFDAYIQFVCLLYTSISQILSPKHILSRHSINFCKIYKIIL